MTNLSKALREKLEQNYEIYPVKMVERQISKMDGTNKFLFALRDNHVVESVLMRYKHGNSVCISSQVGCRMELQILRVYFRRSCKKFNAVRNARTDLSDTENFGGTRFQYCDYGNGRAFG